MGIAAYNRGSRAISFQLDRVCTSTELQLLRDLTTVSQREASRVPFAETVIRYDPHREEFSLMNRQDTGWNSSAIGYESLWKLAREWRFAFVGVGADEFSQFIRVVPLQPGATVEQWP